MVALALAASVLIQPPQAPAPAPIVAVWYRGVPAGTPRPDDLGAIRALGFTAIAWPRGDARALESVRKMAASVGLGVVESGAPA